MPCPKCGSCNTRKNGSIHNKKPKSECKDCGRQFADGPQNKPVSEETKRLTDKLLLERLSLAGICRAVGVSEKRLFEYIKKKYSKIGRKVKIKKKKKGRHTIQIDELRSFAGDRDNKLRVRIAIDVKTREIVGLHIGDRGKKGAQGLWDSLPPVYRQCAVCYTDFWDSYTGIIPSKRHRPVDKKTGKTSYIERFNRTLRQRVSRLVRKALSFSKSLDNHIGAIWYFIHDYNEKLFA